MKKLILLLLFPCLVFGQTSNIQLTKQAANDTARFPSSNFGLSAKFITFWDGTKFTTNSVSNLNGLQDSLNLKAYKTITITAGYGLTGGGNLSDNRTFIVDSTLQVSKLFLENRLNYLTQSQVIGLLDSIAAKLNRGEATTLLSGYYARGDTSSPLASKTYFTNYLTAPPSSGTIGYWGRTTGAFVKPSTITDTIQLRHLNIPVEDDLTRKDKYHIFFDFPKDTTGWTWVMRPSRGTGSDSLQEGYNLRFAMGYNIRQNASGLLESINPNRERVGWYHEPHWNPVDTSINQHEAWQFFDPPNTGQGSHFRSGISYDYNWTNRYFPNGDLAFNIRHGDVNSNASTGRFSSIELVNTGSQVFKVKKVQWLRADSANGDVWVSLGSGTNTSKFMLKTYAQIIDNDGTLLINSGAAGYYSYPFSFGQNSIPSAGNQIIINSTVANALLFKTTGGGTQGSIDSSANASLRSLILITALDTAYTNAVSNISVTPLLTVATSGKTRFLSADTATHLASKSFLTNQYAPKLGSSNIVAVGALSSGSIASGFGSINIGANTINSGIITATNKSTFDSLRTTGKIQASGGVYIGDLQPQPYGWSNDNGLRIRNSSGYGEIFFLTTAPNTTLGMRTVGDSTMDFNSSWSGNAGKINFKTNAWTINGAISSGAVTATGTSLFSKLKIGASGTASIIDSAKVVGDTLKYYVGGVAYNAVKGSEFSMLEAMLMLGAFFSFFSITKGISNRLLQYRHNR